MNFAVVLGFASFLSKTFTSASSEHVTPIEKVIGLVEGMISDLQNESSNEATAYESFACFCRDTTKTKSDSIDNTKQSIDDGSAGIEEKTAQKHKKTSDLGKARKAKEELTQSKQETQATLEKEKTSYEVKRADLDKALSSLSNAISSISNSKQNPQNALLTFKQVVKSNPSVAEAMRVLDAGPKWSFLQKSSVDPADATYKFHSDGILDILKKIEGEFSEESRTTDLEWGKTRDTLTGLITDLEQQITEKTTEISTLENDIDVLAGELAGLKTTLLDDQASMKDDKLYMHDLTSLCEKRAQQWDQRSRMRSDELKALQQAVDILKGDVKSNEVVNVRAFVQTNQHDANTVSTVSFLQEISRSRRTRGHAHFLIGSTATNLRRSSAISFLGKEGSRLDSSVLSALTARASSDPFAKVKGLIQDLLERLVAEATAEATKKGFCDTELGKAYTDRDARLESVKKLSAELGELNAKLDSLELETNELATDINSLKTAMNTSSHVRANDKATNLETVAKAKEGLKAVTEALAILKEFYKNAAKATALVQIQYSPVEEDTSGPGFDGTYTGKQAESKGVIGLLEVIKSDFERTVRTTVAAEQDAAEEYVKFDRASRADVSGKTTKKKLDEQDWEHASAKHEAKTKELQTNMDLLDSALKVVEGLKPMCIDNVMKYDERVRKRDEELESLRRALCILDENKVEDECKKTVAF